MKPVFLLLLGLFLFSCRQQSPVASPAGYDLGNPKKIVLPDMLHEISGLAFREGNDDTAYAEEDENGRVYYFHPGDHQPRYVKFGKKGDYEDLAICNGYIIVLRSDGTLFTFPAGELHNEIAAAVKEIDGLLDGGEYESLYADQQNNLLYVLCKHCDHENTKKNASGYILQLHNDGAVSMSGTFTIDVRQIERLSNNKKIEFHPSAFAKNSATNEWYILSSVNKILVLNDSAWNVKAVYPLNPSLFNQPEGIAFDHQNTMYISNEGGDTGNGNIMEFTYHKK